MYRCLIVWQIIFSGQTEVPSSGAVWQYNSVGWERFRDGWPNIFIDNVQLIAGRDGVCDSSLLTLV